MNCIILTGGTYVPPELAGFQKSLGPYRLATSLEEAGYSTFVLDHIIDLTVEEVKKVLENHIDETTLWVGFSSTFFWSNNNTSFDQTPLEKMYYTNIETIRTITDYVKSKGVKILYGGAKAPFFLADDQVDHYVIGYADISIVEVTDKIKRNEPLDRIVESTTFPEPKMSSIKTSWKDRNLLHGEAIPLELARGCIFKCKFCSYPLLGKEKGTYLRDPEQIRDEMIQNWELNGTANYYITDDTFNDDNDKIESLHKVFTSLPFKPRFSSYLRVDLIHKYPHQADLLTEMGLIGTYFGIETLEPNSAKSIGKGLHPNKVKDRLYWLSERWKDKVNIGSGFILGLPYDTEKYFSELFSWCMQSDNPLQQISFYPLFLFSRPKGHRLAPYTSEFSLNPEIYGYTFNNGFMDWELKEQNLSYTKCKLIANEFSSIISQRNKVAEFQMITNLNIGISLEDLYSMTEIELSSKYDIPMMNNKCISAYKHKLGI